MAVETIVVPSVEAAMRLIHQLFKQAKECGQDVLSAQTRCYVNPGDVYDAYEATGLKPTAENILQHDVSFPLGAVIMHRENPSDAALWRSLVDKAYDASYQDGFAAGFALCVPQKFDEQEWADETLFLRGVYDGVMAYAAVY